MSDTKGPVPPYQANPSYPEPSHQPSYQGNMNNSIAPVQSQQQFDGQQQYGQQQQYNNDKSQPGQQQQQQGQPFGATPQYQTATPLQSIGSGPAPVDCPACRTRSMTRVQFESGNTTYAWAACLCLWLCLGCIPFCMTSMKDVDHYCGHCGCKLATWHRSGRVEVLQFA